MRGDFRNTGLERILSSSSRTAETSVAGIRLLRVSSIKSVVQPQINVNRTWRERWSHTKLAAGGGTYMRFTFALLIALGFAGVPTYGQAPALSPRSYTVDLEN